MVSRSIEQALDTCIAQLHRGKDLEEILAGYPDFADELRPLVVAAAVASIEIPPPRKSQARKRELLALVSERRRLVEMSDGYVNEIKAGVPVAELLAAAPPSMREVIAGAWRMHATPHPAFSESKKQKQQARLMELAAAKRARQRAAIMLPRLASTFRDLFGSLAPMPTAARRLRAGALATALACLVLMVGVAGIGPAAASSLPGEPFYGVKLLGESAQMLFTFDPEVRADLSVRFGEKRFDEIARLVDEGREVPLGLVTAWLNADDDPLAQLESLPREERRELAQALLTSAASQAELDGLLGEAVAYPAVEELLCWARSEADMARGSGLVEPQAEAPEAAAPELAPAPMPMPPPLPPVEAERSGETAETDEPIQVLQPAPVPVEPEETQVVDGPPEVVQPVNAVPADDDEEEEGQACSEPSEPAEPEESEEPATQAPPAYIQPPISAPAPQGDAGNDAEGGDTP